MNSANICGAIVPTANCEYSRKSVWGNGLMRSSSAATCSLNFWEVIRCFCCCCSILSVQIRRCNCGNRIDEQTARLTRAHSARSFPSHPLWIPHFLSLSLSLTQTHILCARVSCRTDTNGTRALRRFYALHNTLHYSRRAHYPTRNVLNVYTDTANQCNR